MNVVCGTLLPPQTNPLTGLPASSVVHGITKYALTLSATFILRASDVFTNENANENKFRTLSIIAVHWGEIRQFGYLCLSKYYVSIIL